MSGWSGDPDLSKDGRSKEIGRTIAGATSITINVEYLKMMPQEYAASLEQLTGKINEELKRERIPSGKMDELQESANDLARQLTYVSLPQLSETVKFWQRNDIRNELVRFGKAIARAESPTIARIVIEMKPLAPISALVGEQFDKIVELALQEEDNNNRNS